MINHWVMTKRANSSAWEKPLRRVREDKLHGSYTCWARHGGATEEVYTGVHGCSDRAVETCDCSATSRSRQSNE